MHSTESVPEGLALVKFLPDPAAWIGCGIPWVRLPRQLRHASWRGSSIGVARISMKERDWTERRYLA